LQEYREYARQRLAEANKEREQRRIQQKKVAMTMRIKKKTNGLTLFSGGRAQATRTGQATRRGQADPGGYRAQSINCEAQAGAGHS